MQWDNKVIFFLNSSHPPPKPSTQSSAPCHSPLSPSPLPLSSFWGLLLTRPTNSREKQTNQPTNPIFSSSGSKPFTRISLPCPTEIEKWPNSEIYNREEIFHSLKNAGGGGGAGAPTWGLKVQRMPSLLLNLVALEGLIQGKWQCLVSSLRKRKEIQKLVAVGTITDKKKKNYTRI